MASLRERTQFRCRDCGSLALRWAGRCGQCGEWNTLEPEKVLPAPTGAAGGARSGGRRDQGRPLELHELGPTAEPVVPTGLEQLDRVLGGGLVASSVTLIIGEPGIGKSTLLLQTLASLARRGLRGLLVSAEESPAQVHRRAARLGPMPPGLFVSGHTDLAAIRAAVADLRPDVLVVDSVQTIVDPATGAAAGTVASVRDCAGALTDDAKSGGPATVLVGHVTKDGSIAGPRALEHLVDTVLSFEGDRHHALRTLRAVKHRFGPVGEVAMWEMTGTGLAEVADAGRLFLADRRGDVPGSVAFAALDGRRPLLVEIQALVSPGPPGAPGRRSTSGYEPARLAQLLAVLDRRAGLRLAGSDVYVSVTGGVRLSDPGADLAVALAVASSATEQLVADDLVAVGEIGLGGEIRQVAATARRLAEAARLGFRHAAVPVGAAGLGGPEAPAGPEAATPGPGLVTVPVATVAEALDRHLGRAARPPRMRVLAGGATT